MIILLCFLNGNTGCDFIQRKPIKLALLTLYHIFHYITRDCEKITV